jgi:sodium/potassium-transporting ATPase subunit alpha
MLQRTQRRPNILRPLTLLAQVFAVKAKFHFPFGKSIVSNKYNFIGIFAGGAFVMFLIYVPPFHAVFGGSHKLLPLYWLIPIAFGCLTLVWACIRVLLARRSMERTRVKDIKGLQMCKFHLCRRGERFFKF